MNTQAIVFPFTWLPAPDLQALARHFSRPIVLATADQGLDESLTEGHQAGRIELKTPFRGDAARLERLRADFQRWAETHRGSDRSIARILEESIPFYDDSHVARIRSEIRNKASGKSDASLDRLTRARLFLQMAERYDRQRRELEADLETFRALEAAMLSDLRDMGQEPDSPVEPVPGQPSDPGAFMTAGRMRAWTRLYLDAGFEENPPAVFATPSKAALEAVLEAAPAPDRWAAAEISGGVDAAAGAVKALARGKPVPPPPEAPAGPMLSLFYLPGEGPRQLFCRLLGAGEAGSDAAGPVPGTLVAWIKTTD